MAIAAGSPEATAPTVAELTTIWDDMRSEGEMVKTDPKAKEKRVAAVRELVRDNRLRTGADYYFAAVVANEGKSADDALLAHDLGVSALSLGDRRAPRIIAVSEDKFLVRIGRPQRYGTQANNKVLLPTDGSVSDDMRHILSIPSLGVTKDLLASGKTAKDIVGPLIASRHTMQRPIPAVTGQQNAD